MPETCWSSGNLHTSVLLDDPAYNIRTFRIQSKLRPPSVFQNGR